MFRSPERPTFVNSDKSRQKHRKEPPVPSLPGALYAVQICLILPHVHAELPFSFRPKERLCFCVAAADTNAKKRCRFYRCSNERQRHRKEVNASYAAKSNMFRERVVKGRKEQRGIACADS